jgi:hypothetical protein
MCFLEVRNSSNPMHNNVMDTMGIQQIFLGRRGQPPIRISKLEREYPVVRGYQKSSFRELCTA